MHSRDELLSRIEDALQHAKADQTEIVMIGSEHGLTRLANGSVHQHISSENMEIRVRAVIGKRVGVATSNRLESTALHDLIDRATAIARVSEPNADFFSLPAPGAAKLAGLSGPPPTPAVTETPKSFSPEARADVAAAIVNTATGNSVSAAGHVSSSLTTLAIGNSLGIRAYHAWPECGLMAIMTRGAASGYASWAGTDFSAAPAEALAGQASSKCLASEDAISVSPGAYTVILEPAAVAEMLGMLGYIGLGALAYQEERSFMNGVIGEQVVGRNITLADNAYHPGMITLPFDYEGVPRRAVPFFEHGVARDVVHDSYTANKEGKATTGHALPAPNAAGPIPLHLVLDTGDQTHESLVRGIERGILVTRFHYVNVVHPKETILTGMTRDGTFLIENGSISKPVKNLRFTQSILQALRNVTGIEHRQTLVNQEGIYCLVPSLRIDGFTFTS